MSLPKQSAEEKTTEVTENAAEIQAEELDKLKKELEQEKNRAQDYLNRLKYLQADFENYRKRVERDFKEQVQFGNERLVKKLLTVMDELELAIEACKKTRNKKPVVKGIEMVSRNLKETLKNEGLENIEALGKTYDPTKHEAVANAPDDTKPQGTVIEEIRKGFMFRGKVIRPSMVKVAISSKHDSTETKMKEE